MGIGTLRRYHEEAPGAEQSAPEAAVDNGQAAADAAAAHEQMLEERTAEAYRAGVEAGAAAAAKAYQDAQIEAEKTTAAAEQAEQVERAKAAEDAGDTPESVNETIVEAGAPEEPKHGELERPNRGSSRALWLAYAEADTEQPEGWAAALNRDEIAVHYLGVKPE